MARRRVPKFMHLLTILAMVVQLGVIGFHYHAAEGDHDAAPIAIGHLEHRTTDHHTDGHAGDSHHEDDHDDHHHDPIDGDHQDCDLCLFKTAFGHTLVPLFTGGFEFTRTSTKLHFTRQDRHNHADDIKWRYRARAPPPEITLS